MVAATRQILRSSFIKSVDLNDSKWACKAEVNLITLVVGKLEEISIDCGPSPG